MRRPLIATLFMLASLTACYSEGSAVSEAPRITVLSGAAWQNGERINRLFAVQSCLTGDYAIDARNYKVDCGSASRAALSDFFTRAKITCNTVETAADFNIVTCRAIFAGQTPVDLGSMLIRSGYAFAAITPGAADQFSPVYKPYAAIEADARKARAGLWGFRSFTHPAQSLARAYTRKRS